MNEQEKYIPYYNLANAIILQAIDDVIAWKRACKTGKLYGNVEKDGKSALSFLSDDSRLQTLTSFTSDEILTFAKYRYHEFENGKRKYRQRRRVQNSSLDQKLLT